MSHLLLNYKRELNVVRFALSKENMEDARVPRVVFDKVYLQKIWSIELQ